MVDSVSRSTKYIPNGEMGVFGFVYAAVLLVVLVPLLPFVVLYWVYTRLAGPAE